MMSTALLYTTRNITGEFSAGLLCNMSALLYKNHDIDLLTSNKTDKGKNTLEKYSKLSIRKSIDPFSLYYKQNMRDFVNWKQFYDTIDVSSLAEYDELYIFGGLLYPQRDIIRGGKFSGNLLNTKHQMTWLQVGSRILNIIALYKAHNLYNIPLHEFSYDSDELSSKSLGIDERSRNYYNYHIYDMPEYGLSRIDSIQCNLASQEKPLVEVEKLYDLTFGYTVFPNGGRKNHINYVDEIKNNFEKNNIYCKNSITGQSNSIDRELYLQKIAESKYTLIIPSYDNNCFSLYRFLEAIHNDCLPLIHEDCPIDEINTQYNVDLSILKRRTSFSEIERKSILADLKNKMLVVKYLFRSDTL